MRGRRQVHAVLQDADDEPRDDVDGSDEHGSKRIALCEADGSVHRAVEIRLAAHPLAPFARLLLVDEAGVQVRVDRHLPSGHRVEGEPRRHFRNTDRAVIDDDVLDGDQDEEDHDADDEVAADDELAERHDHVPRRLDALAAIEEHEPGRGDIERQTDERQQQEERRKHREFDRLPHVDRREQQRHGQPDVDRQEQVEQQRRQRNHHQQHDHHHRDRREEVGRLGLFHDR